MIELKNILYKVTLEAVVGNTSVTINAIQFDSRKVSDKDLFVAIKGTVVDGHTFIESVIEKGAKAIICEDIPDELNDEVTYIKVDNSARALAIIASNFYGIPSENLKLVGVTGTNGKTSVAGFVRQLLAGLGHKSASAGTLGVELAGFDQEAVPVLKGAYNLTTPDSVDLPRTRPLVTAC